MFNTLNRFISRLDSDASNSKPDHSAFGFQVLRNKTPDLAIEPWFDFIVGINGRLIDDPDASLFAREVRNCAGNTVTLGLWSAKGQRIRTIHIPVPLNSQSLGLTLQWASINTVSNIWHILDVSSNSPAEIAGFLPYSDYIIGTPEGILHGEISLGELVKAHIGRPLRLYIYNNEFNITREVVIYPRRDWGGEGALGCVLGFGALHRLPAPLSEPVHGPGETLFEIGNLQLSDYQPQSDSKSSDHIDTSTALTQSDFLVPAQLIVPQPTNTSTKKREKRHGNDLNTTFIDEYFLEGEKKSREIDHAPNGKTNLPPPPTKAGTLHRNMTDSVISE